MLALRSTEFLACGLLALSLTVNTRPLRSASPAPLAGEEAVTQRDLNHLSEALVAVEKALQSRPDDVELLFVRADIRAKTGRGDLALTDLDRAVSLRQKDAQVFLKRGNWYAQQNLFEQAEDDYNRAIQLDPRSWRARQYRGVIRDMRGDTAGSLADLAASECLEEAELGGRQSEACLMEVPYAK